MMQFCRILTLVLTMFLFRVNAAVFYVSTSGNDTGNGSQSTPWRTISQAAKQVNPGDTVSVGPGTYTENVTLSVSGTESKQITFQGSRGIKGEWLTRIDPTIEASSGWVAAPEIGKGVYKQDFGFQVGALICDGKSMEGPWAGIMEQSLRLFRERLQTVCPIGTILVECHSGTE